MSAPLYSLLIVVHVLAAVVGFGALGATGAFASAVRRATAPFDSPSLRRYFKVGHNYAARVLYLVPVFGFALVYGSKDHLATRAFPWIGLGLWLVALGVAAEVVFPAEADIQKRLALGSGEEEELRAQCRRCERGATVTSVLFVVALIVMIAQP